VVVKPLAVSSLSRHPACANLLYPPNAHL